MSDTTTTRWAVAVIVVLAVLLIISYGRHGGGATPVIDQGRYMRADSGQYVESPRWSQP